MKTRDLFAGCFVTIAPREKSWLVSLMASSNRAVTMRLYHELPDALEAIHQWVLMLSDEAELSPDAEAAADLMREVLGRLAIGEKLRLPLTTEQVLEDDTLRSWFEREMGPSKGVQVARVNTIAANVEQEEVARAKRTCTLGRHDPDGALLIPDFRENHLAGLHQRVSLVAFLLD